MRYGRRTKRAVEVSYVKYSVLSQCLKGIRKQIKEERYPDRKQLLNQIRKDVAEMLRGQMTKRAA